MNKLTLDELLSLTLLSEEKISKSDGELLEVFNSDGSRIGVAPRLLCHRLGLIHQVVYLMIENEKGEILLQTRGDTQTGRLDIAVGGHMSVDDKSPTEALFREVQEELGIEVPVNRMIHMTTYRRDQHSTISKPRDMNRELRHVFLFIMKESEMSQLENEFVNREEKSMVRNIKWFTREKVTEAIDESRVADGLGATFVHYLLWKLKCIN